MQTRVYDLKTEYEEGMSRAAHIIAQGGLVAFPTETVYGLGADAMDDEAVGAIFSAKGRPQDNPLIVHIASIEQAELAARDISPLAKKLMRRFCPGPFTAILPKRPGILMAASCGGDTVGVRMPGLPAARELIARSGRLIAAPSANLSGRPSPTTAAHVLADFEGKIPIILDGGACSVGVESTVCDLTGDVPRILRPGGVTAEMLREAAGEVIIAPAVLSGLSEGERALSPGMKYRHYSPRAKVYIVQYDGINTIANKINIMYDRETEAGRRPVIFCADAAPFGSRRARVLGATAAQIAAEIFSGLRRADEDGFDVILFEALDTSGMGLAVMNRMLRAAGFSVI